MPNLMARLVQSLQACGNAPDAEELADIVWLWAWQTSASGIDVESGRPAEPEDVANTKSADEPAANPANQTPLGTAAAGLSPERSSTNPWQRESAKPAAVNVRLPQGGSTSRGAHVAQSVLLPGASALPSRIAIARRMYPIRQRRPSRTRFTLDEHATVDRFACGEFSGVVFRPESVRSLHLTFVVDGSTSMWLWRRSAAEFLRILQGLGAFLSIRVVETSEFEEPRLGPATGSDLVLIVTDAVSADWWSGRWHSRLEKWGKTSLVALVSTMPESMWSGTLLGHAQPVRLRRAGIAARNSNLLAACWDPLFDPELPAGMRLPIAVLEAASLGQLARLICDPKRPWAPGLVLPPNALRHQSLGLDATAEERVRRFRQTASRTAQELAGLAAVWPVISLQLLQIIRRALLPAAGNLHDVEVILGGILQVAAHPAETQRTDDVPLAFFEGVADRLLNSVPMPRWSQVVRAVSDQLDQRLLASRTTWNSIRALVDDPEGVELETAGSDPLFSIALERFQRLGGAYSRLAERLKSANSLQSSSVPASSPSGKSGPAFERHGKTSPIVDKLNRVRRPRVHLSYEVFVGDAVETRELPFVVGVIANLSNNARGTSVPLRDRKFVEITRDNFDNVLESYAPEVSLRADNRLSDDGSEIAALFQFRSLADFAPEGVAAQTPVLRELLDIRARLSEIDQLASRNERFAAELDEISLNSDLWQQLSDELLPTDGKSGNHGSVHERRSFRPEHIETSTTSTSALSAVVHRLRMVVPSWDEEKAATCVSYLVQLTQSTSLRGLHGSLQEAIQELDVRMSRQTACFMHHPAFLSLEATWRGLHYLVMNAETGSDLKIRILDCSLEELRVDLERAIEPDQCQLFRQLNAQFELAGGQPLGVLIGDYAFTNSRDDVGVVSSLAAICTATSCPFIGSAAPALLGLESFTDIEAVRDFSPLYQSVEYIGWRSLRQSEDSGSIYLTLPRILARLPYGPEGQSVTAFQFQEFPPAEQTTGPPHDELCWMNAAFALGVRLAAAYSRSGFCTEIRGVEGGGRVESLPHFVFDGDDGQRHLKGPTELQISDRRERELSHLGFVPLCHFKNTDYAVFFGGESIQQAKVYDKPNATADATIMTRLTFRMAVSRFAQYLRIIVRDRVGSFQDREDLETYLNRWINEYVDPDPGVSTASAAVHPLLEARLEVRDRPGFPGAYSAVAFLKPRLPYEELSSAIGVHITLPQVSGGY